MAFIEREMTQGDTLVFDVDAKADLTGCLIWCTAKHDRSRPDAEAVWQKTLGSGITVPTPANGIATVTIAPRDTTDLVPYNLLWYDLQYETSAGVVTTAERGVIYVLPGATGTYS
jgi:hypothetical protein